MRSSRWGVKRADIKTQASTAQVIVKLDPSRHGAAEVEGFLKIDSRESLSLAWKASGTDVRAKISKESDEDDAVIANIESTGKVFLNLVQGRLSYQLELDNIACDLAEILKILRDEWIGNKTKSWLKANILGSSVVNGKLTLAGNSTDGVQTLNVWFKGKADSVTFLQEWPQIKNINAEVAINLDGLSIYRIKGSVAGICPLQGEFKIPSFRDQFLYSVVQVKADSPYPILIGCLERTPLRDAVDRLKSFLADDIGQTAANIQLRLPLQNSGGASKGTFAGTVSASNSGHARFAGDFGKRWFGLRAAIDDHQMPSLPEQPGVQFETKDVKGLITFQQPIGRGLWKIRMSRALLNIKSLAARQVENSGTNGKLAIDPSSIPGLDVHLSNLVLNGKTVGELQFQAAAIKSGLSLKSFDLQGTYADLKLDSAEWRKDSSGNATTRLTGRCSTMDAGNLLQTAGLYQDLKKGHASAEFALDWPGGPTDFDIIKVKGKLIPVLKNATLKSANNTLLKLADLLTLNLLQVYKKGAELKMLEGMLELRSGIIAMLPLKITLNSVLSELKGELDLNKMSIAAKGEMNLRFGKAVGAVAIGVISPIAGVAYLGSGGDPLFDLNFLDRISSFSYKIDGPWEKPRVSDVEYKPYGL
jgi:uncharacterized protein YhdP